MADEKPIIVVKKKGHHGGHHGGAWKVAYADFVTAMMAFFMVMWLVGTAENPTKEAIAAYFRKPGIFETGTGKPLQVGGAGIFEEELAPSKEPGIESGTTKTEIGPEVEIPEDQKPKDAATKIILNNGVQITLPEELPPGGIKATPRALGGASEELQKFAGKLTNEFAFSPEFKDLLGEVDVTVEPDGIKIEIIDTDDVSMFTRGSAQIAPDAVPAFRKLAAFVKEVPFPIDVIGHTDAKQFSSRFNNYSNWELSADRANAARRLLEREGIDPTRIRGVVGVADRQPRTPEDPYATGNRRIEIKLKLPPPVAEEKLIEPTPVPEKRQRPEATRPGEALFPNTPVIGPSPIFDFD